MGAELVLFVIIGAVAIVCAAAMLLSENAVHSALFLIVNFICVALLYLMLEAPFLAMVQIAVYAGAIMVLFLFVIMLLGAEQLPPGEHVRIFPWFAGVGVFLAASFVIAIGVAIYSGEIDQQTAVADQAVLRVVNASVLADSVPGSDVNPVYVTIAERRFDVFVNGELFAEDLTPEDATTFERVAPGEVEVMFAPADTAINLASSTLTLEAGQVMTVVLTGADDDELVVNTFIDDLSPVERRSGRVTVFNGYPEAVSVVNIESELFADSRKVTPITDAIPTGGISERVVLPEGRVNWTVIRAGEEQRVRDTMNPESILARVENLEIPREETQLIVVTGQRLPDGTIGGNVIAGGVLATSALAAFGSPQSVGELLFVEYLLPFQLVAILLLAAMVGVIVLTLRQEHTPKPSRAMRRKVSRPLTAVIAAQTGANVGAAPALPEPQAVEELPEPAGD